MIPYRLIAEVLSYLGLVTLALILHAQRDEARANFATQIEVTRNLSKTVTDQTEITLTHDRLHALEIENAQDRISSDSTANVRNALELAHLAAASHARSLCPAGVGDKGNGGKPGVFGASDPAGVAFEAGYQTELDASTRCADNTIAAEGWLDWWGKEAQIPNR